MQNSDEIKYGTELLQFTDLRGLRRLGSVRKKRIKFNKLNAEITSRADIYSKLKHSIPQ